MKRRRRRRSFRQVLSFTRKFSLNKGRHQMVLWRKDLRLRLRKKRRRRKRRRKRRSSREVLSIDRHCRRQPLITHHVVICCHRRHHSPLVTTAIIIIGVIIVFTMTHDETTRHETTRHETTRHDDTTKRTKNQDLYGQLVTKANYRLSIGATRKNRGHYETGKKMVFRG